MKDNPEAAESLGVVVFHSKMAAAAVSAFFTADRRRASTRQFVSYIDPESVMTFHFSLLMALPAVLGGIGTLWGPAFGAAILIPLTEMTRSYLGGSGAGHRSHHLRRAHHADFAGAAGRPVEPVRRARSARRRHDDGDRPCWRMRRLARFGGLVANGDISMRVGARRDPRPDRAERRGQVDAVQRDRGLVAADEGRSSSTARTSPAAAAERCQLGIARTFQVPKSFDSMTVIDNVIVGAYLRHRQRDGAPQGRTRCSTSRRSAGGRRRPASELTPPEKRRLEVARALATEPKLLLLDEVLTGLTPMEARLGVELVRRVRERVSPC